jgi:hypothetical protein
MVSVARSRMTRNSQLEVSKFRMAWFPTFVAACLGTAIVADIPILFMEYFVISQPAIDWSFLAKLNLGAIVVNLLVSVALPAVFTILVTRDGIRGHTFWGVARFIPWNEIKIATPINFIVVPYVRIHSKRGGKPIWLPLFLTDRAGLSKAIRRFASAENPLFRCVQSQCHRTS